MKKCLALVIAIAAVGCSSTQFVYPVDDPDEPIYANDGSAGCDKRVCVLPFEDTRGDQVSNKMLMWMVPLMPYGWKELERPEESKEPLLNVPGYVSTPYQDFAMAAAKSLQASNLFGECFYDTVKPDGFDGFVLLGTVSKTSHTMKMYSYCLGSYGPLLWLAGFPSGSTENHIVVDMVLQDKNKKVVWAYSIDDVDYNIQWLYYCRKDCTLIATLLQRGMNDALRDLADMMAQNPKLFQ